MVRAELENLLRKTIGLNVASIGAPMLEHAIKTRRLACGLPDLQAYWEWVRRSETELQELIETVIVPETWFFRDAEAFNAMVSMARGALLRSQRSLRLLSLPCSTGEEPYSIAMAMLDAGFPANCFNVDGVDISLRALIKARHAEYGKNSFRGSEQGFRDRYFRLRGQDYQLVDTVRRQVHFQQGNLFTPNFLFDTPPYDIIFCRNVLIYFDPAAQQRAVALLARLLTDDGCLFVGPAEASVLLNQGFASAKLPLAFAFHKQGDQPKKARPAQPLLAPRQPPAVRRQPTPVAATPNTRPVSKVQPPIAASAEPVDDALSQASHLADQGKLTEAAALCESYLNSHGPSPRAFYLLGLVRDASGSHGEAAADYRKALYLDPNHYEALIHLAFLLEQQGDGEGAQRLYVRAKRVQEGGASP
jgi:chemotaxis protein methyltransferase WspC